MVYLAEEPGGFGWTTFGVVDGKRRSRTVGTRSGAVLDLTVIILATSGCRAIITKNPNFPNLWVSISVCRVLHCEAPFLLVQ